jgi:hypothetical protein
MPASFVYCMELFAKTTNNMVRKIDLLLIISGGARDVTRETLPSASDSLDTGS